MRGTITPIQLHSLTAMAMVTGALAAWIGFAIAIGRSTLAVVSSILFLSATVILDRIAWSVIDTLETDTPTSISEEDHECPWQ
jgi:uncharacterized membrane protein YhhN